MSARPSVLLVDDDADTREMYGWSLELRGFDVLAAGTAPDAAAIAATRRPDAIVTDLTLPGEDGLVLASRIRASAALAETPLLLVSGRAFVRGTGERALQLFDRILLKPVLPDQLIGEMVPLMLNRTTATLERQLRAVRQQLPSVPLGSAAGRIMAAVQDATGRDSVAPAALLADSNAHYIGVNDAACAMIGQSREQLLGLNVWDLTPQPELSGGLRAWEQFVQAGTLAGAYLLNGPGGTPISASFAAFANILPGCHLSLLQQLPAALVQNGSHI